MMYKKCRCGKKIEYTSKYCEKCTEEIEIENKKKIKRYDKEVRNNNSNIKYKKFYDSSAWRLLSDIIYIKYNGLCIYCLIEYGLIVDADTIHHITELKEDWSKRLEEDNLMPLCHDCHNKIHGRYTDKEKVKLRDIVLKYWEIYL